MTRASDALTRFAPAPTGYLHLGHVVNAIYVWGLARATGAEVLLRIEDHDRQRCRPEYEAALLDDLDWLGFAPDRASDAASFAPAPARAARAIGCRSTNRRRRALRAAGLVYGCRCSRQDSGSGRDARTEGELTLSGHVPRARSGRSTIARPGECVIEPGTERFDDLLCGPQRQDPAAQCGDRRHSRSTGQLDVSVRRQRGRRSAGRGSRRARAGSAGVDRPPACGSPA